VKLKVPVIWVNRKGEELEAGAKRPTEEVKNVKEALELLGI
jgi:2-haloacid dehalogenase/putative hydrolase of the HAD superfamily